MGRGETDALDDGGKLDAGKPDLEHERRRHRGRQRIGELEQSHEQKDGNCGVAGQEILETGDGSFGEPAYRIVLNMCRVFAIRGKRLCRLGRSERRRHPDQDEQRHQQISGAVGSLLVQSEAMKPLTRNSAPAPETSAAIR